VYYVAVVVYFINTITINYFQEEKDCHLKITHFPGSQLNLKNKEFYCFEAVSVAMETKDS